jgi:hypothetical protein
MAKKIENKHTAGFAITSLILGLVSFIPLVGVLLGILAIVFGFIGLSQIKKNKLKGRVLAIAGILLGIFGIIFTILLYSSLFYFGFVAENGPFSELKVNTSQQILTQDAGAIELYKQKYGQYPESLEEATNAGYTIFGSDHYLKPFYYEVSLDGQSYELKSAGPDKEFGTADDIFPNR